jgi:predicted PurR-regulated permease PerM
MSQSSWDQPVKNIFLLTIVAMLFFIAWQIREIFTPLIISALISYLFSPLINLLTQKTKLPRKVSANIIFFVIVITIIVLLVAVIPTAFSEIGKIVSDLNESLISYQIKYASPIMIQNIPVHLGDYIGFIRDSITLDFSPAINEANKTFELIRTTSKGFLWFLVIIVTTYNLMTEWETFREWLFGLAPLKYNEDLWKLYYEIRTVWMNYLGGQIRLMIVLAVIYAVAWSAIGLPGAIFIGILAGFLNLVPEVGPGIAAFIAITVAWLEGSTFVPISNELFALLTGSVYLILNNVKTIYLQPRILGKSVFLHEGIVFVAIIAAVILQGVIGVLIVVPVLASSFIISRYVRNKILGIDPFPPQN